MASHSHALGGRQYNTRGNHVNYRDLTMVVLPRAVREKQADSRLYSVDVVEKNPLTHKVKIHYIGYDSDQDDWRDEADVVDMSESQPSHLLSPNHSPYEELALLIKSSLQSSRKGNPEVKLAMNFDKVQFDGGIRQLGTLKTDKRGIKKYSIRRYSDLEFLLGRKWFIRGINENGDFCYVVLDTVRFYLSDKMPLADYHPTEDGSKFKKKLYFRGYNLVFSFVRGDGVASNFNQI